MVALRKESVDRNPVVPVELTTLVNVALRKESVDRNPGGSVSSKLLATSLSARRAWIEINMWCSAGKP